LSLKDRMKKDDRYEKKTKEQKKHERNILRRTFLRSKETKEALNIIPFNAHFYSDVLEPNSEEVYLNNFARELLGKMGIWTGRNINNLQIVEALSKIQVLDE